MGEKWWPTKPFAACREVLVIQSGPPELVPPVVRALRARSATMRLTVLVQRNMAGQLPRQAGVTTLVNEGSAREMIETLRARPFEAAVVLWVDAPGYWKLKLLPFLLDVERVVAFDEHGRSFPVSLRDAPRSARHAARRAVEIVTDPYRWRAAIGLAVAPATLAYLWGYERSRHHHHAALWKQTSRPDACE